MVMRVLKLLVGVIVLIAGLAPSTALGQEITVTLLGTGNPNPVMNRFGPSILVEAGGQKFLFDAGRGALQRLTQVGVRWQQLDGVFLTHLHSDHVVGFPDLWLTGWLVNAGRNRPLAVWGPRGTTTMMSHLEQAFAFDIQIRKDDDKAAPDGVAIRAEDIDEGVIVERDGVKISAFRVDHSPVEPAFGYRIDYAGRSVVLSGDTRVSANLIRHAQRVDLLIHEVVSADLLLKTGREPERVKAVIEHHATAEQVGEVFARTQPRLAVYSHIGPPAAVEQDLIPPTRRVYVGPLEVGEDLMVIVVGETVDVRRSVAAGR
jgi:ribonuclease Z